MGTQGSLLIAYGTKTFRETYFSLTACYFPFTQFGALFAFKSATIHLQIV